MAADSISIVAPRSATRPAGWRRAAAGGIAGTALEGYDFAVYTQASALIFPQVFFPEVSPAAGVIAALAAQFVGFAARPIGAAVFGHLGDRIGRRSALVATMIAMGTATIAVGLLPGYAAIGLWAPILLVLLRVVQGVAVGGEVGGSVVLSSEWAPAHRRGLAASLPLLGLPLALLGATLVLRVTTGESMPDWGWRIAFLLSAVVLGVGLLIRRVVPESPSFDDLRRTGEVARRPLLKVLRSHPRSVLASALLRAGESAPQTLFTVFVLSYGTGALHLSRSWLLDITLIAGLTSLVTIPLSAHLSDRWGGRRLYAIGLVAVALYAFPYFSLLDRRSTTSVLIAVVLSFVVHDIAYGPQPGLIVGQFPAEVRTSGVGLGAQLSSVFAGGPAPLIAAAILAATGSTTGISWYIAGNAVVSLLALLLLPRSPVSARRDLVVARAGS